MKIFDHTPYSKMAYISVFFSLHANQPLLSHLKENIILNLEFKNKVTRGIRSLDLKENKHFFSCINLWFLFPRTLYLCYNREP